MPLKKGQVCVACLGPVQHRTEKSGRVHNAQHARCEVLGAMALLHCNSKGRGLPEGLLGLPGRVGNFG